jgi:hypothetical protein
MRGWGGGEYVSLGEAGSDRPAERGSGAVATGGSTVSMFLTRCAANVSHASAELPEIYFSLADCDGGLLSLCGFCAH